MKTSSFIPILVLMFALRSVYSQEEYKLTASGKAFEDWFGNSVSVSGDCAIVGAYGDDDNGENSGSAYIFEWDGANWIQQAKLTASDGANDDWFGWSVAMSGDCAVVGVYRDDDNGSSSGSAYVFLWDGFNWVQQAKLTASDGAFEDWFGYSVSVNGDWAIVGAPADDDTGVQSGSAYIFQRDGANWVEQAKLTASDGANEDYFGWSVSISGDRAIVGAYRDDDHGESSGSAYIFQRDGANWVEQPKLTASDGANDDYFGHSVSVSGDRAIVGALLDDDNGSSSGSAYVFEWDEANWVQQAKLIASDGANEDYFGRSVSMSGDRAIVGADRDDDNGYNSGSAYVFELDGANWIEQAKLTASDGAINDLFGHSVSVSGDRAIVGALLDDDNVENSGSGYVFEWDDANWVQQAKLTASDGAINDYFGNSVSVNGDWAIVGASRDDDNGSRSGSAYIFEWDEANWIEQAKLTASDGASYDYFGNSVSVSGDCAIVGAYGDDDNGSSSGSAYIFEWDGSNWVQQAKLTASDGVEVDLFGMSVSMSGGCAIVGAYGDDDNGSSSGSAYIFDRDEANWIEQAKLTASDGAEEDYFGRSVSMSGDCAIVGAPWDDDNGFKSGSAYIFEWDGANWIQQAKLTASDGAKDDWFGFSVSVSGDCAIVGALLDDDNGSSSGSAYVFRWDGANWIQQAKLTASDGAFADYFGRSVSMGGDWAIVGADLDDDNGSNSGSAYVFLWDGFNWVQQAKLIASDGANDDWFGFSVSVSRDWAIVGAFGDDDHGNNSGSAYVYVMEPRTPEEEIEDIITFFDESAENGSLEGSGPGVSAPKRLNAMREKLEAAQLLINGGYYEDACIQLSDLYKLCDGEDRPPDHVQGPAAEELANRVLHLMETIGCSEYLGKHSSSFDVESLSVPKEFELLANYPNPFNPTTVIGYSLAEESNVILSIYNVLGKKIRTLVSGKKSKGGYGMVWDSKDDQGRPVSDGIYIYHIEAIPTSGEGKRPFIASRKMILMK